MREELSRQRPELVFSLVESLAGADSLVYLPAAVLDVLGVPYCGCRTEALFLTTHKTLAKERMHQAGLPTPAWLEHEPLAPTPLAASQTPSTWILKGVWDQGSRGLDDDSVLRNIGPTELRERLAERVARSGRPCFAEQFIEGREFNLGLLAGPAGPESLPPAEIEFLAFPPEKPRIVGHRAKWDAESFECIHTPRHFDFPAADAPLLHRLRELARQCWKLFKLRGWARVDFRVDAAGEPWILEVNGNPCISPDAGFVAAMEQASITYDQGIQRIVEDAFL
jgi:D-alanine-D-alanine ligase